MTDATDAAGAAGTDTAASAGFSATAAAGTTKPAAGQHGGQAPAGQAPETTGGASAAYRPEGLPDHLYGASERETLDKLWNAYLGYRRSETERGEKVGAVPDAPDKYTFQPAETIAPYLPNVADDPVMKAAQAAAHKHGLGDKQFAGFVNEFMGGLLAGELLDEPFSAEKERAIIAGDVADPAERAKAADRLARDTVAYIDALAAQGKLPKETADWAKGRTDRGHFIRLVQTLRAQAPGLEVGGQAGAAAGVSEDMIDARIRDPRNDTDSPTYSESYRAETMRLIELWERQKSAARA